jgi:hypothetical protein
MTWPQLTVTTCGDILEPFTQMETHKHGFDQALIDIGLFQITPEFSFIGF